MRLKSFGRFKLAIIIRKARSVRKKKKEKKRKEKKNPESVFLTQILIATTRHTRN